MTERPAWTRILLEGLDGLLDHPSYVSGVHDPIHDAVEQAVRARLCDHYEHEIIDDQCNIPAHRYCVYCGQLESTINTKE